MQATFNDIRLCFASALIVSLAGASLLPVEPAKSAKPELMVYTGAGCTGRDALPRFEKLVGRKADGVVDFFDNSSWANMLAGANWSLSCWDPSYRMAASVPMLVQGTTLKQGAAGAYDEHYRKLAALLVEKGRADAYVRIGWEFNGNWYAWNAAQDPETWVAYFRRIATIFRQQEGGQFKIVWNPAQGPQSIAASKVYPGDDVVDVIATDFYNRSYRPQDADPQVRWTNYVEQPYGLAWISRFAIEHHKPLALPEWGTGTAPDKSGGGDDPLFVRNTGQWISENNVAFHGYWDYQAPDYQSAISTGNQPKAAAAFVERFSVSGG